MLAVLWERSPFLSAALVGPLAAIALYQRSVFRELAAMRLALTDPLTGLGNHRHFHERLDRDLAEAEEKGVPLSVCILDIDNFKELNDTLGHPKGDLVLSRSQGGCARTARRSGSAATSSHSSSPAATSARPCRSPTGVVRRVSLLEAAPGLAVRLSAGVVTYPQLGLDRSEIVTVADQALYLAKEHGKGRVRAYHPDLGDLPQFAGLGDAPDREARLRPPRASRTPSTRATPTRGATPTSSRSSRPGSPTCSASTPRRSSSCALPAASTTSGSWRSPRRSCASPGRSTSRSTSSSAGILRSGFRMLRSLGVEPVSTWVLHHHERWDGRGYPHGLGGEEIPLGSRILFVADAYDAMTSDRIYQEHVAHEDAVAELERCAGTQFDPQVVAVFVKSVKRAEVLALKSD